MGGGLGEELGRGHDPAGAKCLWELNLSRERLIQLGLALGADVPVFVLVKMRLPKGGRTFAGLRIAGSLVCRASPPVHVRLPRFSKPAIRKYRIVHDDSCSNWRVCKTGQSGQ